MIASEIDVHLGRKLKMVRTLRDMTQCDLGVKLGVTLQQVQKYERGYNRISASRLYLMAKALDVRIDYFYQGLHWNNDLPQNSNSDELAEHGPGYGRDNTTDDGDALAMARLFIKIKDSRMRKLLLSLVKLMVSQQDS